MNARSLRRFPSYLLLALALLAPSVIEVASQTPAPTPLTMLSRDGRRSIPLALVSNQEFVAVDDLATIFQLSVREDALGALTITYKDKTIVLTNQALASVGGRLVSLPAPAARVGRRWFVPVEFISRALALVHDTKLELRKPAHLLIAGDLRVPRLTVRYDVVPQGGRLTIDANPRANSTVAQGNDRLTVQFEADALDVDAASLALPGTGSASLVRAIRVLDATTLEVDLGSRVAGFRATTLPMETTMRLAIDVLAMPDAPAGPPGAVVGTPPPRDVLALGPPDSPFQTVVIDPGHGGDDVGVVGAAGTKEKDVTLAVARRVKASIEARLGVRVLLTRDDDRNVPIDDRTSVANNNKANLFLSLHANASLQPAATGAIIYYAAFDSTAAATLGGVARVPTFSGGTRDLELVAWDLAQTHHLDQSMVFAGLLDERMRERVALVPQSIARAPLSVLQSANMPAVLVELGFLTNSDQERQLAGGEYQNTLVQAITEAIIRFRDSLPGESR